MGWFDKRNGRDEPGAPHPDGRMPEQPPVAGAPAPPASEWRAPNPEPPRAPSAAPQAPESAASSPQPQAPRPSDAVRAEAASIFADSVDIEGSLEGDGDVILRGRVRGSISITGTLIVGETGRVQADVIAREVVNAGTVEGNIHAREKVRVQSTGLVQGDIDSPSIVIDDGGGVEGFVQMEPPGGEDDDSEPLPTATPAAGRLGRSAQPRPWQAPAEAATMAAQATPSHQPPPAAGLLARPAMQPAGQPLAQPAQPFALPPTHGDGPLAGPLDIDLGGADDEPLLDPGAVLVEPPAPLADDGGF